VSWLFGGLAASVLLAACTAAISLEPAASNLDGDVTTVVESDSEPTIPAASATVAQNDIGVASVVEQTELSRNQPPTAPPQEPVETPMPEATAENPAATPTVDLTEDTTIRTEVQLLGGDDRYERLRIATQGWNTNWSRRIVEYDEILTGGPARDGIRSLDSPAFVTTEEASVWLADNEPVISLEINGDARAYPLQILMWHEIANDVVGGVPVVVTFCPLCNSALVFDRRVAGEVYEFGTSGLLRHSDLIMYDRTTETLWQQFTGDAIVGFMVGRRLRFLPSSLISFADFSAAHPDGAILSRDTGFDRRYGLNPYAGYDTIGQNPGLFIGPVDGRLSAMERVVTVPLGDIDVAYPLSILSDVGVINDFQGAQELVVFHTSGTSSALGDQVIANAEDVGATGVFDPNLNGQKLTFASEDGSIVDVETGSIWDILGRAIDGPLEGATLAPIIHGDHFWFSWAAFKPDTIIFQN
jgi:hypothetical protein